VPPIAVFDTNVLVSGTGWQGNPYRCLEYARASLVEGVTCKEILDELVEKLQVKLHFSDSQATDTVADLLTFLRLVTITNTLKAIPADPDDDKVLECAVVGGAAYICYGRSASFATAAKLSGDYYCQCDRVSRVRANVWLTEE
jgi:uncharacterized protein